MLAAIIHWEHAAWVYKYEDARRKVLKYYTLTIKALGCNRLLIVDVDGTDPLNTDADITATVHRTLADARAALVGHSFVYIEDIPTAPNLASFQHPVGDTCYIVGSDYGALGIGPADTVVRIPATIALWAHVSLALVLNDRQEKA